MTDNKIITDKNKSYTLDGLFNYYFLPEAISDFKGELSLGKKGFFKGTFSNEDGQFEIYGHLKNPHNTLNHLTFIVLLDNLVEPKCAYSLFSDNVKNLEGNYVGSWNLNSNIFDPKLLEDYSYFWNLVRFAGEVRGYAELNLKNKF